MGLLVPGVVVVPGVLVLAPGVVVPGGVVPVVLGVPGVAVKVGTECSVPRRDLPLDQSMRPSQPADKLGEPLVVAGLVDKFAEPLVVAGLADKFAEPLVVRLVLVELQWQAEVEVVA